jgi:hypothetical protein
MKIDIVSDDGTESFQINGNTIFPWFINVRSIEHQPDKIIFHMCGKYQVKENYDNLWILGKDVDVDHLEEEQRKIDDFISRENRVMMFT